MYVKPSHRMPEAEARAALDANLMALVMSVHEGEAMATQMPLYKQGDILIGHMARANLHWRSLEGIKVCAVFLGADAYISPSAYPAKAVHGKVVPTWLYERIDVRGTATTFQNRESLLRAVSVVSDKFETGRPQPWAVSDAPEAFIARLLKSIVGIRIEIDTIIGKAKLDQDKALSEREGVIADLELRNDAPDQAIARRMKAGL